MTHAVIAATGLFTPEQSVSNAELVDSYNAWADGWNARHAAQIEAGELEAKPHSSPEFIEKASGIKQRFVMDKAGVIDPARMAPNLPERSNEELSILAEMAVKAARQAIEAWGKPVSEIGAVLASQPQWSNELAAQVGSYLMHRLAKVALVHDRHGDYSDPCWANDANDAYDAYDAADGSWDAPPSAREESSVESGGEAGGAGEPAFSFVTANTSGRGKQPSTTKYMKASEEFLSRMLPNAMSPNVLRDRLVVHPAEFPMLTPPLAWSKSEDEEGEPVGGCFHHSTGLVRTRFAPAQQLLRRTPGSQLRPLF